MRIATLALVLGALGTVAAPQGIEASDQQPSPSESTPPLPDGNGLVRSMVDRQRSFEAAINDYTYDVVSTEDKLDGQNRAKERHSRRYQIFFVMGEPVRSLVEEDGRPLSPAKQRDEERRVRKVAQQAAERHKQRPDERDQDKIRISEILDRFDFTSVARESIDGRPAILVAFQALPGHRDLQRDNVLRALRGRLWIAEEGHAVVRAEISNSQKIKIGGGLLASLASLDVSLSFVPVNDVWLPIRTEVFVAGRILLVKGFRRRVVEEFSNYRRFQVSTEERGLRALGSE